MFANETLEPTALDDALQAVARSWSAILIEPRSKKALSSWKANQTLRATRDELEAAFQTNPSAGLGFVTGEISGLVALDIDPYAGGDQSMDGLVEQFGALPITPVVRTGGGGFHYFFSYPKTGLRNSAGKLGDGLDIRGDGGYVVAPPSIHPNGTQYRWAEGRSPEDIPLAPLPNWVIERLSSTPTIQQSIAEDVIPEGKRHHTLVSLGGVMVSKSMSSEAVEAALLAENARRCEPPLPSDEVLELANDLSARYSPASPAEAAERLADRPSQATQIVDMALNAVSLWHSDEHEPFATMEVNGHQENQPLRSRAFRDFLDYSFYRSHDKAPNSQARQAAIDTLCGIALYDSPEQKVWTRIGEHSGSILLDLGAEDWKAVAIRPNGWEMVNNPPVKFRRSKSMRPLPVPLHNGSVDDLREYLNLGSGADWVLIRAWLVQSVFAKGSYPILALHGEAGSAKSTAARVLKSCVDPTIAPLRSQPRNEHDLVIAARNSWTIGLDNLSSLPVWLSDALCRLSTGGGLGTRQLYSDADESLFDVQRPVILNGITSLADRGDLQDRCIPITLPVIDEDARRSEDDFWDDFNEAHPAILGGLLDVVSGALRELPRVKLDKLPRMADFARRAVAAERGQGWPPGTFMSAYAENRVGANDTALEASPVAGAVAAFMALRNEWSGTAAELLAGLNTSVEEAMTRRKGWPVDGAQLGKILRRIAPNLRRSGTDVQLDTPRRRMLAIRKGRDFAVITDMPSQEPQEDGAIGADGHDSNRDSNVGSDSTSPISATVHARGDEGVERLLHDSTDSNDSKIHNLSNEEVLES